MAAEARAAVHHDAPRWSLRVFDATAGDFAEWSEFDTEVERLSIEVRGLSCEDLRALIESSTCETLPTEHRTLHQEASHFVRWGRRGGLRTLALYGRLYFSLLARFRWGRIEVEALTRHRAGSSKGAAHSDPPLRI